MESTENDVINSGWHLDGTDTAYFLMIEVLSITKECLII